MIGIMAAIMPVIALSFQGHLSCKLSSSAIAIVYRGSYHDSYQDGCGERYRERKRERKREIQRERYRRRDTEREIYI